MIHYTIDTLTAMKRMAETCMNDVADSLDALLRKHRQNDPGTAEEWARHEALQAKSTMYHKLLADFERR